MRKTLFFLVVLFAIGTTMMADNEPFTVTDANGKSITNKFTGINGNLQNTLTLKYNEATTGLTFKINGTETSYDSENGITIKSTTNSQKNDVYTVTVYNGANLVAEQTFTYIPVVNLSSYKALADGTEAILLFTSGNKVTYVSSDGKTIYFEDATKAIRGYNLGLKTTPTAFKAISAGSIWGIKKTISNLVEIRSTDETSSYSTITQTTTDVTPTDLTATQIKQDANQLRYAKISGAKIIKSGTSYYVECPDDNSAININDIYSTNVVKNQVTATSYGDLTCIVGNITPNGYQVWPIALDNVSEKISDTFGTVTWTIDLDGNMVFTPTDGKSGQFAGITSTAASQRSWAKYVANVKTIKFKTGVQANASSKYVFYNMTNLQSIDFTNFDASTATAVNSMFQGCASLKSVDFSSLNLSAVTTFDNLFSGCTALESINFGDNTFANATSFASTFKNCSTLKTIDMSKVTGVAVTKMGSMFVGCTSLETIDLRAFSTAKVTSCTGVFGSPATKLSASTEIFPKTLILSKNFGATATGTYVTIPGKYMVNPKKYFADNSALYAYNETLDDYGTYTQYDATATMKISDAKYATFCAPFDLTIPDGVTASKVTGVTGNALTLENIETTIPANTPVVLYSENLMDETTYAGLTIDGNPTVGLLTGVFTSTDITSGYVLQNQTEKGVAFYNVNGTITVPANRAYLTIPNGGAVKAFGFDANNADAIIAIIAINAITSGNTKIYDVNGHQINKLQKGINIVNGVKVFVK